MLGRLGLAASDTVVIVVGRATVHGRIQTSLLLLGRDPQLAQLLQDEEEDTHQCAHPGSDHNNTDQLAAQQHGTATRVECTVVGQVGLGIGLLDILLLGQQADNNQSPGSAESVHGGGAQGVVDLELQEHGAHSVEDDGTHGTSKDSGPGLNHGAGSGDGHKANQGTVAQGCDVPSLVAEEARCQGGDTTSSTREGGGHSAAGGNAGSGQRAGRQGGTGVESVPTEPQKDGTEDKEGGRVAGHINGVAVAVESAKTGANKDSAHQTREATNHVYDTAAGKVNEANAQQLVSGLPGTKPALVGPGPADNHGVHEGGDEEGVGCGEGVRERLSAQVNIEVCGGAQGMVGMLQRHIQAPYYQQPRYGMHVNKSQPNAAAVTSCFETRHQLWMSITSGAQPEAYGSQQQ